MAERTVGTWPMVAAEMSCATCPHRSLQRTASFVFFFVLSIEFGIKFLFVLSEAKAEEEFESVNNGLDAIKMQKDFELNLL